MTAPTPAALQARIDELEAELANALNEIQNRESPAVDSVNLLWRDIILASDPNYGDWEYPGQAYRHILDEYTETKARAEQAEDALAEIHKILVICKGAVSNDDIRAIEIISRDATRVRPKDAALPAVAAPVTEGERVIPTENDYGVARSLVIDYFNNGNPIEEDSYLDGVVTVFGQAIANGRKERAARLVRGQAEDEG